MSIAPSADIMKLVNIEFPCFGVTFMIALEGGMLMFKLIVAMDGIKKWGSDPDIRRVN